MSDSKADKGKQPESSSKVASTPTPSYSKGRVEFNGNNASLYQRRKSSKTSSGSALIQFKSKHDKAHFLEKKDRFDDLFSLTGEVQWAKDKIVDEAVAAKLNVSKPEEREALFLLGTFVSDTSARETKPLLEFAVRKIVETASVFILVADDSCSAPSVFTVSISQTITDSCKLYFCFEDSSNASYSPVLWLKQSWTSSSGTQTFSVAQQLATGLITVSGSPSTATVNAWVQVSPGNTFAFWDTPVNHWDPGCQNAGSDITISNQDTINSKNFGIGIWTEGSSESVADVMVPTGVIQSVTSSTPANFNSSNRATTLNVYVNLATDYSVGQLMAEPLPSGNLLLSVNYFGWTSSPSYTLNEPSPGTYTLS